ncbi:MAG: PilW family protein [Gammaproteobacteria bacterium]|jgi:type IV pilus assembly protein PilW|nr:PilW family protein [Gammaproteobacteria bacterium]MDH3907958.1 PilW family protein [Gammaproteobacteria bacterium]MDH3954486.1 PilW family protein [Gammaproteobacteria bacterium]MDH4004880.1 PilW family protein [Gammaproteobacteria bacterium]
MRTTVNPFGGRQHGITLVELMVALAIGSFLMIGAIQIYSQSRQAFTINESIARVQETAQFALDTIEADLRMASNWGRTSRALSIDGRTMIGQPNPKTLAVPLDCGEDWSIELGTPVDGFDNVMGLTCPAQNAAQANSDVLTVRRASVNAVPLQAGRLQIQTTRIQGEIFDDGNTPPQFDPLQSATHNLMVSSYYVDANSDLIPGVPTLRRKVLGIQGLNSAVFDQEIAPGVENLQIQFGIDMNEDNTVDRYVDPGDEIYNPEAPGYSPGARVLTARVWLVVRGLTREAGVDDQRAYNPGNVNLGTFNDEIRRMQVSKTILLRNTRI